MPNFSFDTYADYGLSENPFVVQALKPDELGKRLLVGRDQEIQSVAKRLHKKGKITCLDGHVGVGKTSLVNVASYRCYNAFLEGSTTQLLVPVSEPFQLRKDDDVNGFCASVFRRVAQTLLKYHKDLQSLDQLPKNAALVDSWLNSPIVEHVNGALSLTGSVGVPGIASIGATTGGGTAKQVNQSTGFSEQGFETLVRNWLSEIFVEKGNGGVVCVIDNLELLETGAQARRMLEVLRDRLFNIDGLRWVFCGANGVIHSLASSERLSSFLSMPVIDVAHVFPSTLEALFRARLKEFALVDEDDAWKRLPIRLADLQDLYRIVNFNLRDLLALGDEYCEGIHDKGVSILSEEHKARRFAKWLETATTTRYGTLQSRLPADAWTILDLVMSDEFKGTFGVGDYQSLNQNSKVDISKSTFEKRLRELVKYELISKSIDDSGAKNDDFKREVFSVTAKGALVHYARLVKQENQGIKPVTWLRTVH